MAQTIIERKHLALFERAEALADKVRTEFAKNHLYHDVSVRLDGAVRVDIVWGDWKHDHLFVDHILSQLGARHYSTDVTEEDGSDTYSATHIYFVK